jgi:hypothetical protein
LSFGASLCGSSKSFGVLASFSGPSRPLFLTSSSYKFGG